RFAFRQGPGRTLLNPPVKVDDGAPTTATLAPRAARGSRGYPLPMDTRELLESAAYPRWPITSAGSLGHVLVTAFGLQRREPSNAFNDHRAIASVRSKFPVHVIVVPAGGPAAYLDLYRHALVALDGVPVDDALRPPPGSTAVMLAARYTDLPTAYARLRGALCELEIGVNLRSLFQAADLMGVSATLDGRAGVATLGADLLHATGAGTWGPPALAILGTEPAADATELPASGPPPREIDRLLDDLAEHWSVDEAIEYAEPAYGHAGEHTTPGRGLPLHRAVEGGPDWARALWQRTAGRAPKGISGFTAVACSLDAAVPADLIAFAAVPPPSARMRSIARRVRISVAFQHAGDLDTGTYLLTGTELTPVRIDAEIMDKVQRQFGYPMTAYGACGIRHAGAVFTLSADVGALIEDHGAGAWSLLQRYCGWVAHGICTAAGAHGLFARPARSFDEYAMRTAFDLPSAETPVFIVVCGRTQMAETMLDLRP
ncbi:MAG TPA: hypothetical protein VGF84_05375, partial [Micromonosporaceae bacterium]